MHPKIDIAKNDKLHPSLKKTMSMYEIMQDHFPDNFESLLPDLNHFLVTGLVPDSLSSNLSPSFNFNMAKNFYLFQLREDYLKNYGYTLLSHKLLEELSQQLAYKKVLEIGAGTGFLAKNLIDRNVSLIALDYQANTSSSYGFQIQHTNILNTKGVPYLKKNCDQFDTIILGWPDYNTDFAAKVLEQIKSRQRLYYIGENYGGCTANDRFFDLLEKRGILNTDLTDRLQKESLSWPGIHDTWYVYDF